MMTMKNEIRALLTAALVGAAGVAAAAPVEASYTLTGTAGDWTLDFDVSNDLVGSDQSIYFFGVAVDGGTVTHSPQSFNSATYPTWSYNANYGGSSLTYNAVWFSGGHVILSGDNLDGFLVHSDAVDAPTSVNWFAFSSGSEYTGGGNFNTGFSPGWEGVATAQVTVVPEPANIALLLAGIGISVFAARRRALLR